MSKGKEFFTPPCSKVQAFKDQSNPLFIYLIKNSSGAWIHSPGDLFHRAFFFQPLNLVFLLKIKRGKVP